MKLFRSTRIASTCRPRGFGAPSVVIGSILLLALTFCQVAEATDHSSGAEPKKPAWQWTLEERLSARENVLTLRKARDISGVSREAVTIQGSSSPEIFLPSELYGRLLWIAFNPNPDGRDVIRQDLESRVVAGGVSLPAEFWSLIAGVSQDYFRSRDREETLAKALGSSRSKDTVDTTKRLRDERLSSCRLLRESLTAARAAMGDAVLDHFLYAAVAPTTFVTVLGDDDLEALRSREGGCR